MTLKSRCAPFFTTLLALVSMTDGAASKRTNSMPYLRESDLSKYVSSSVSASSSTEKVGEWMSLSENVEFMPNTNLPPLRKPRKLRKLEMEEWEEEVEEESATGAWEQYDPYSVQPFVEGMSEYDEYQQAWRLLGFMIDCNSADDDDGGSGSEDVTEDGCARYVLWAAYVDLDYEGGGIGEYQYWDRDTQSWNDTACYYAEGGSGSGSGDQDNDDREDGKSRCAKMDCHLESTHFSVLGFFKHRNYDDWMEQLFKHEGMCVWTEEEYAFMKNARKAWPQGCVDSGLTTEDGEYNLYYNIKPMRKGRIGLGLYIDSQCLDDYSVTTEELEEMIGNIFNDEDRSGSQDENYDFSSDSLSDSMDRWNSAFDVWHTCHPCVAYDIENLDGKMYTDDDDYYYYWNNYYDNYYNDDGGNGRRRKLGGEYNAQGDVFECYDDAGYTNVNQCMKFSAKTVMKTATFRDLSLGRNQATLVEYPLSGFLDEADHYRRDIFGNIATYFCLSAVALVMFFSVFNLYRVSKTVKAEKQQANTKDSLLTE
mmetsp:Transcript_7002/g.20311  ORF Transcript_7002/g.20311 Transcript_7002/m.20311 type:complete len:536 (-) Transcript_7002:1209-2816(-)|eukprot:CAMPEP_0172366736 /NCGR_PEP_ID=MMETSP1060-20121228/16808_1 /TAXON_ID=37318 /ORGANISM="Pseudo-nitzschia pungens, Strain cf. cingulata" /LENGTH=535 /DNA_ID=CAMNT_0013090703 /DNA_START=34 /DNA_END=1641 /DNA_ORIENTATION=+